MQNNSILKILAISIVLLMVVSCLTPSIAVDDNLSEVKRHYENASQLSNTVHIPDNYTKIQQTADNASASDSIIVVNETNIEDVEVNKSLVAIKSENLTEASSSYPFFDDMEGGTGNWTFETPWDLTEEYAHSGSYSWTDSPNEFYQNNVEISLNMSIDLRFATMPVLSFWHKYSLESNRDYGYVDVSDDSGQTWTTLYFVTGDQSDWVEEKIDLTEYTWKENVWVRFKLKTDGQNRYDGWYIDDVKIAETTATISYPFFDDMENVDVTKNNWHSSSWEVLWGPNAHSGVNCWTDSPEGNMPAVRSRSSLTIAGTVDLSTAVNPQMTFWHRGNWWNQYGYVEVSDNYGQSGTYTTLKSYRRFSQNDWVQDQVDLSDYAGLSNVRIRFRLYNYGDSNDGWYIDDVRIDNAPEDVVLSVPTNVTMHGADLSWSKNTEADFAKYEIYRATGSYVNRFNTLIAVIEDQDITSYKDIYSILEPDYYYYRVYVVDDPGMYSVGSNAVQATYPIPPKMSYPFFDDMESGSGNWAWGTPWALTTKFNHSGSYSWTDSPGTSYNDNVNSALEMHIDLRDATMPVLSFWHRYSLEPNRDYGYVDVSGDAGQTWTTLYFMTGHQTAEWVEEKIDLTDYALTEDVRIRFRLKTDGQTRYDGWYIDDVRIGETTATISYPFFDDMESVSTTENNWHSSSWDVIWTPQAHSGVKCLTDSPEGNMPAVRSQSSLTIAGTVDLSTAVNPQMTFWHRGNWWNQYGYVEVSDNYGQSGTYTTLKSYRRFSQNDWVQDQVDLSGYVGLSNVRIRFRLYNYGDSNDGWYIDDVRVDNAPEDVSLSVPTNVTMHGADLSWTKNTEADFAKYEIYRATGSYVNRFYPNTLIAVIEDCDVTNYRDVYSILEPDYYYYRVYVIDDQGMYSVGSNAVKATYPPPPKMSYPFFDDLESGDGNWGWGSPWALTTKFNHSGSHSWTDSPGTSYNDNVNSALEMYIDLRDATMPILSFWHRYSLEPNRDYGYVDVSGDAGLTWVTLYFVTGHQTEWVEEKIDLTEYALKEDVRIRFRLKTDGQTRYDGWYIDEVKIAETTATIGYPFFDDMEDVAATENNWHSSSWDVIWTPQAHSGVNCWTDSPEGNMPAVRSQSSFTIAGTIDLSTAVNPQMTFWHRGNWWNQYGYVDISDNYGQSGTYTTLKSYRRFSQNDWIQDQVDLSGYVGLSNVRIRFRLYNYGDSNDGWYIDDVRIGEKGENQPPNASFTYSPENPEVNQTITFDASASYDPDGEIVSYDWDFGDGGSGTGEVAFHSYSSAGERTVTLTVTDDYGATNSTSKQITIGESPSELQIGDIVITTVYLHVRNITDWNNPLDSNNIIFTMHPPDEKTNPPYDVGKIIDGPITDSQEGYTWWNIEWDNGEVGWSAEKSLEAPIENWLVKSDKSFIKIQDLEDSFNYQGEYELNQTELRAEEKNEEVLQNVTKYANEYKISPALIMAVIRQESDFTANAKGDYWDGEYHSFGYMQVSYGAATDTYKEYTGDEYKGTEEQWKNGGLDPDTNIKYGVRYLRIQHDRINDGCSGYEDVHGDILKSTISAYNAGHPTLTNRMCYVLGGNCGGGYTGVIEGKQVNGEHRGYKFFLGNRVQTVPSGTIKVGLGRNVDALTKNWDNPTKYNAPVFRRGMDNPVFILELNSPLPENYEALFEIYSPSSADPICSGKSAFSYNALSLAAIWFWTDTNGDQMDKNQIPIGRYTLKGYLVNKNNLEDKKFIGSDDFYVIFDFEEKDAPFITLEKERGYATGGDGEVYPRPPYELHGYQPKIWEAAIEWANGAVTTKEAVDKISELVRRIDGEMVFHHADSNEAGIIAIPYWDTSVFLEDEYDNDFDGERDEADEEWEYTYIPNKGGFTLNKLDSEYDYTESRGMGRALRVKNWRWWGAPPPPTDLVWVDSEGNEYEYDAEDGPDKAARIAWYFDTMKMLENDFDPENKIPDLYQHSLGVCEDYAMLTVGYLRAIGVPSRAATGEKEGNDAHAWLQWVNVTGDGQWSHLDTDFLAENTTWEINKFNPKWYGETWDHVFVRNSENIDDVSDIADQYNTYAKSYEMSPKMLENETICSYEIVNIPIFKLGENSTVKLNITNPTNESVTVIVVVELLPSQKQPGRSQVAIAGDYKQLTIPAILEITECFNFTVPGHAFPSDNYNLEVYEVVDNKGTLVLTQATQISAEYMVTAGMPDKILYNQPFIFNVTIKNNATAPIHNVSVELDTHYYFNTTELLEKEMPVLDAGENYTFTWALIPIWYGDLRVDVGISTKDAGSETKIVNVPVFLTSKLWINAQVPKKVLKGDDFVINATVFNSGDISSDNVTLNITTPENVTANRTCVELGIIGAHENKTCSFRIFQNESKGFLILLNATALNATATNYAFIEIIQPEAIFDTEAPANPYPSIMGNHTGTIKPHHTVIATKMYTYPCAGTGGHTEYARIWNLTWNATATWEGYAGDWHNISFDKTVILLVNETYNYTIRTGSYPQIHRTDELDVASGTGTITCNKFIDANGRVYYDRIPAIRLE